MALRADTALRIFPGGETCEVEVPAWIGIDGEEYGDEPETWVSQFGPDFYEGRRVGHGSVAGFVVIPKPGQFS